MKLNTNKGREKHAKIVKGIKDRAIKKMNVSPKKKDDVRK